jgi:hypothetical protein
MLAQAWRAFGPAAGRLALFIHLPEFLSLQRNPPCGTNETGRTARIAAARKTCGISGGKGEREKG